MSQRLESPPETWVPSRFNLPVAVGSGQQAVLNTLTGALVTVNRETWRRQLAPGTRLRVGPRQAGSGAQLLYDKGFLVASDVDELDLVRLRYQAARFSSSKLGVTVVPTLACNLSCRYCFENRVQENGSPAAISRRLEDDILRQIVTAAQGKRHLEISWFGGEPLLALKTIQRLSSRLIPACDAAGVEYSSYMVSNGTLLNRAAVRVLQKCRLRFLQVTVDVPSDEKQDRRGRGTIDQVLEQLAEAASKLPLHLRINLVRDDPREFDLLYQKLLRLDLHRGLRNLFFAYVFSPECGARRAGFAAMSYPSHVRIIRRERAKALALGLPVGRESLSDMVGCIATSRSHLVIGPDGSLCKCTEDVGRPDRSYGSVIPDTPIRLGNLVPWLTYDWLQSKRCRQCPLLPECAGGCPHRRRFQLDQVTAFRFCDGHRQEVEDQIREWVDTHPVGDQRASAVQELPAVAGWGKQ